MTQFFSNAAEMFRAEGMLVSKCDKTGYFVVDRLPMRNCKDSKNCRNRWQLLSFDQTKYKLFRCKFDAIQALAIETAKATIIPVNSIQIPAEFVQLCSDWNGGQACMLYAVSSTGNLTIGTHRPLDCDNHWQWYLRLWDNLGCDIRDIIRSVEKLNQQFRHGYRKDLAMLRRFKAYADSIQGQLRVSYNLQDWPA
jgi:hypothetical protein